MLDASAPLACVFNDERNALTTTLMDAIGRSETFVPSHRTLEVTNGLLVARRRGRLRPHEEPADIRE
jgi:hypothetical protein